MGPDSLKVDADCDLENVKALLLFPELDGVLEFVELCLNGLPTDAEIQVFLAKCARVFPNIAEHFFVKLLKPIQVKWGKSLGGLGPEVFDDGFENILGFRHIQLSSRPN